MLKFHNILLTSGTSNAMAALEQTGNNFLTEMRTLLVVAIAVAITYSGFRLLIGRAAKEDIPSILVGALLVAGAVVLATWVVGNIAF